jgi:hypothetical protein
MSNQKTSTTTPRPTPVARDTRRRGPPDHRRRRPRRRSYRFRRSAWRATDGREHQTALPRDRTRPSGRRNATPPAGAGARGSKYSLAPGSASAPKITPARPTHGRAGDPRDATASGEAFPCGGSGSAKDQVAIVRRAAHFTDAVAVAHSPRLYPAGVSFKPRPRRMLSLFAFPRSAVKDFKRPSKVVDDAGHFKS